MVKIWSRKSSFVFWKIAFVDFCSRADVSFDRLEEFKKLNPPVDLVEGAEIEMTIRGDTLLYRNAVGGVGAIHSAVFTRALCDVYYGADPVSPTHKQAVLEGIPKLS